jgi:hypothetical protein
MDFINLKGKQMAKDKFTENKQKIRQMDFALIERYFHNQKGELRYLGLPSTNMVDLIQWKDFFAHFSAVERGKPGESYIDQHNLMLTALQNGLADRMVLLRGDLDEILLKGKDSYENPVLYPYDVVSLDYSGGLVYKNGLGRSKRTESIGKMVEQQADFNKDFLLFASCNMDFDDQGEIRRVFQDINREFGKMGIDGNTTVQAYLKHKLDEARLKVYVPYLFQNLSNKWYQIEFNKTIYYSGNKATRMMHFAFWMKRTTRYAVGKPTQSALIRIVNMPAFACVDGDIKEDNFGIPNLPN